MKFKTASELIPGDSVLYADAAGGPVRVLEVKAIELFENAMFAEIEMVAPFPMIRTMHSASIVCIVEDDDRRD